MISAQMQIVLKGVRTILLGNGSSKLMLVVFELMIAKFFGVASIGLYAIAITISQVMSSFASMGLGYGIVQHLAIYEEQGNGAKKKNVIFFALSVTALFTGVLAVALFLGADFLAVRVFSKPELAPLLMLAAPILFFDTVNQNLAAVFRGLRQFKNSLMTYDLVKNLACLVLLPVLLFFGVSLETVLLVCLAGTVMGFVYGLFSLSLQRLWLAPAEIDFSVLRDLLRFSKLVFVWNFMQVIAVRLFILAAGVLLTSAETGALAIATRISMMFIFFQTATGTPVQAEFARFFHLKDTQSQKDLYQGITQGLLAVVTVPAIFIMINPVFVSSFFGAEYMSYAWIIWPLLFAHFLNVVTGPAGQVLVANEKQKLMMWLTVFDISMQFLLVVPLMHAFGVAGGTLGEAFRIASFVLLRLYFTWAHTGVHAFGRSYLRFWGLTAAALSGGLALTAAGTGYITAVASVTALYGAGVLWLVMQDKTLQEEIKILLRFRRGTP